MRLTSGVALTKHTAQRIQQAFDNTPQDGSHVVSIKKRDNSKSAAQIRTIHNILTHIGQEYAAAGGKFYSLDAWKEYMKGLFGATEEVDTPDGIKVRQKSYSRYTTKEMADHISAVDHYAASELGILVPLPGVPEHE
jgi:hypothetical protein